MTVKDWCAQNNVSPHAYYYWKRLAKEAYMDSVLPEIVPIALPATDDNALSEAPHFPAEAHSPNDSRDLYNSRNSYNSPDTLNTKSPVSAASENVTISVNGIQINIDTTASDDLIFRVLKAVRYA